jgi:hypothetical protein
LADADPDDRCALIGLSVWLYLPLRASLPAPMVFGPDNTTR